MNNKAWKPSMTRDEISAARNSRFETKRYTPEEINDTMKTLHEFSNCVKKVAELKTFYFIVHKNIPDESGYGSVGKLDSVIYAVTSDDKSTARQRLEDYLKKEHGINFCDIAIESTSPFEVEPGIKIIE